MPEALEGPQEWLLRLVPPVVPADWQDSGLGPEHFYVETAIQVLARRKARAWCRKVTARAKQGDYVLNLKKPARLLKACKFLRVGRK